VSKSSSPQLPNPTTIDDYLTLRLDDQQKYHSTASSRAQNKFKNLSRTQIVLAALIPVIAIVEPTICTQILTGVVGATIAIVGGFLVLGNYQQNWILNRTTSEALKVERVKFVTRCGSYSDSEITIEEDVLDKEKAKNHILLCRLQNNVESILGNQNSQWQQQRRELAAKQAKAKSKSPKK